MLFLNCISKNKLDTELFDFRKKKHTSSIFHILDLHDLSVDAASEHILWTVDGFSPLGGFLPGHPEC